MTTPPPRPEARLHVDAPLADGVTVEAGPGPAHYLGTVLRLGPGAAVALFNGRDGEWLARIAAIGKGRCRLLPEHRLRDQSSGPDLWLCFALIKRARLDWLVEKATELGAARLQPVITRRTEPARVNLDRLRAHAVEAAEQCERLDLPELGEPVTLAALLGAWPAGRVLVAAAEAGATRPIAEIAAAHAGQPAAVLVGPEGGFAPEELDALRNLPFVEMAGLGPRILRAETAALAALAGWQAVAGDRDARPAHRPAVQPTRAADD